MHKICWLALFLLVGPVKVVQATEPAESMYLLSSITTQYGWSLLNLTDGYLSDLPYSGYGLHVSSTTRRLLSPENQRLSQRVDFSLNGGAASNAPQSAFISYLGGNLGYGLQSHFVPVRNLQMLLGGTVDSEFGAKMYSRDVNNAFNMDLALNLNLAATFRYDLQLWQKALRFQIDLRSPIFGLQFVPERGESYSEIFLLGSTDKLFHLSSLHNRNGLNMHYMIQLPLKRTVLNLGFQTDYLKYVANGMFFKRNITSMQVGVTYDLITFGGRKNKAPAHFISSEW